MFNEIFEGFVNFRAKFYLLPSLKQAASDYVQVELAELIPYWARFQRYSQFFWLFFGVVSLLPHRLAAIFQLPSEMSTRCDAVQCGF
jgi:hypothetical protein